jgi:hypothetical protein
MIRAPYVIFFIVLCIPLQLLHILSCCIDNAFVPFASVEGDANFSGPRLLKLRRAFVNALQHVPATAWHPDSLDGYAANAAGPSLWMCFAWFQYLTLGLESALAVFHVLLLPPSTSPACTLAAMLADTFPTSSTWHEWAPSPAAASSPFGSYGLGQGVSVAHQWTCNQLVALVTRHVAEVATAPRVLRSTLEFVLQCYPASPAFLSVYIASEQRGQLTSRLRRHFDEALDTMLGTCADGRYLMHSRPLFRVRVRVFFLLFLENSHNTGG